MTRWTTGTRHGAKWMSRLGAVASLLSIAACSDAGSGATDHADGSVVDAALRDDAGDGGEVGREGGGPSDSGPESGGPNDSGPESGGPNDGGAEAGAPVDGGGEGSTGEGGPGVTCGNTTCASGEFCLASCSSSVPLNPLYCSEPLEGGTCPIEHPLTNCLNVTGLNDAGAGCTLATYTYTCHPLAAGQTTYDCSNLVPQWSVAPITNRVATCCED